MLLFDINKLKQFQEADADGQPLDNEQDQAQSYNDDPQENLPAPTPTDNGEDQGEEAPPEGEEQPTDQGTEEPPPEDAPQDYNDYGGDEGGGDDGGEGAPPQADNEPAPIDDLKQQEEEMFNQLTPEQLDLKHKELKQQYVNMYDSLASIIDRISDVSAEEENIKTIEFISNKLSDLKDMILDYMTDVYKTKSYIENSINYNRFLAILNGINKILEEMNSKKDEK